jgi:hypothetical protein
MMEMRFGSSFGRPANTAAPSSAGIEQFDCHLTPYATMIKQDAHPGVKQTQTASAGLA